MTTLDVQADRLLLPAGRGERRFVKLGFRAPAVERQAVRAPVHVAVVLDRSGSMAGRKLELARRGVEAALRRLGAGDRFSLVVYDGVVDVLVPSQPATPEALARAVALLNQVEARGSTALFDGFRTGAEQVLQSLDGTVLGKVLLLTDGQANVGLTDPAALAAYAAQLRERGVLTSTFGVGADFNQVLLERVSDAGGGNFYFVEQPEQFEDVLTGEVGEALRTVARDVVVEVQHPGEVGVDLLDGFRTSSTPGLSHTALGSLVSEQHVNLFYELRFPAAREGHTFVVQFTVRDRDGVLAAGPVELTFRSANDAEVQAETPAADVLRVAAGRLKSAFEARLYALNYQGEFDRVRELTREARERLRELAASDPDLTPVVEVFEASAREAESPLDAVFLKQRSYEKYAERRGRDEKGRART
jgi:Ca-activated chloride channel homolog